MRPEGGERCLAGPGRWAPDRDVSRWEPCRRGPRDGSDKTGLAKCRACCVVGSRTPTARTSAPRLPCSPRIPHRLDRRRLDQTRFEDRMTASCRLRNPAPAVRPKPNHTGAQAGLRSRSHGWSTFASGRPIPPTPETPNDRRESDWITERNINAPREARGVRLRTWTKITQSRNECQSGWRKGVRHVGSQENQDPFIREGPVLP